MTPQEWPSPPKRKDLGQSEVDQLPGTGNSSKTQPRPRLFPGEPRTPEQRCRPPTHLHGADAQAPVDDELAEGG